MRSKPLLAHESFLTCILPCSRVALADDHMTHEDMPVRLMHDGNVTWTADISGR